MMRSRAPSALVDALRAELPFDIVYVHCPAANISIARNACLDNCSGDFLAFIDDDETASPEWLVELLAVAAATGADAVLGPVSAVYDDAAPGWMQRGDFHSTQPVWVGGEIRTGYTCNVLLRRASPSIARAPLQPGARPDRRRGHRIFHANGRGRRQHRLCAARAGHRAGAGNARALFMARQAPLQERADAWPAARPGAGGGRPCAEGRARRGQGGLLLRRRRRHWRRLRSSATATRCAASCMSASSVGLLGVREIRLYGDWPAAREAQQCSLT